MQASDKPDRSCRLLGYDQGEEIHDVLALNELPVGRPAVIHELRLPDSVEHHLMHLGFSPEARVVAVRRAPAGDPTVYAIDGMEIALRRETARGVLVELLAAETQAEASRMKVAR